MIGWRLRGTVRPGRRVVGRCQVEEIPVATLPAARSCSNPSTATPTELAG